MLRLIKKFLFRLVPLDVFIRLRAKYRRWLKTIYKPITEDEFRRLLTDQLGVVRGSVVMIHSSFDQLNVEFDVVRTLDILLETVGEEGTILFPAWHFSYRAEEYLRKNLIFDVRRSPSVMGLLSEAARRHPNAHRSLHPLNSIVAIGKDAEMLVNEHVYSLYPCDERSPYYKMLRFNSIIIGIGVDTNFLSFVHCPEDILKEQFPVKTRMDEVFEARVRKQDGTVINMQTFAAHPQIHHNDITSFFEKYVSDSRNRNLVVRGNRFFTVNAQLLYETIVKKAEEGVTIYTEKADERNK
jgi:aminoglycoside N3'-acetyltransferase